VTTAGRPAASAAEATTVPSESVDRLPGPDVVRAVALIGVVVMNYHGYLIFRADGRVPDSTVIERFFDPFTGPLSTRFAATFVLTAGVGITLLTRRVVAADDRRAITRMRWRLVRRGIALYVLGRLLDQIWAGTIILFYGAMFAIAALLFTLATRWIVAIGIAAALAGWGIVTWAFWQTEAGESVVWLYQPGWPPTQYVVDVMVNGTHPLLPWFVFLCAGIVIGRHLDTPNWRGWCGALGAALFLVAAIVSEQSDTAFTDQLLSRHPFDRGLVYVASALGTALLAFTLLSWFADRAEGAASLLVEPLRRAGQMTLTLYIAHVLVFNLLVDWLDLVQPGGVATALTFALIFWALAIAAGSWWHRRYGRGPAERVYRWIGG